MCLWFACFGLHKHDDDYYAPPSMSGGATKPRHDRPTQPNGYQQYAHPQHGAYYGNGGYRASPHHTTAGANEAGRKASNDARRGSAAHATVAKDAAFTYTAPTTGTLKPQQPAWNGRVAEGAGHGAARAQAQQQHYYEREPVHREAAATGHHYYSTATATADHERY